MFKLDSGEKIILELRRHWFVIFVQGVVLFFIATLPLFLSYLVIRFFPLIFEIQTGGNITQLFSFFYFLWLLAIWVVFFVQWTDYYLDVWYITPVRVVAIDQKALFRREVIDLRYEKIQDVTVEVNGIVATILNFGDIHVQTAGETRKIILANARDPHEAKRLILAQHSVVMERSGNFDNSVKNE